MDWLALLIGPDTGQLAWWQAVDRAVAVFFAGLALVRLSGLRTFSNYSPLDTVVAVIIGSSLGRIVTGNTAFGPTLLACGALVALHRLLAQLAFHVPALSELFKGRPRPLVVAGAQQDATLRAEAITQGDLLEAVRLRGVAGLTEVEEATLERNGAISLRQKS